MDRRAEEPALMDLLREMARDKFMASSAVMGGSALELMLQRRGTGGGGKCADGVSSVAAAAMEALRVCKSPLGEGCCGGEGLAKKEKKEKPLWMCAAVEGVMGDVGVVFEAVVLVVGG